MMALTIKAVAQTIRGSRDIVDTPSGTSDLAQSRSSVYGGASAHAFLGG